MEHKNHWDQKTFLIVTYKRVEKTSYFDIWEVPSLDEIVPGVIEKNMKKRPVGHIAYMRNSSNQ